MTMIDTSNTRFGKAVVIADTAGQWAKCRGRDGLSAAKAYGVPSQHTPHYYYLTTQTSCTCEDARRQSIHLCKHALAVQLHVARLAGRTTRA